MAWRPYWCLLLLWLLMYIMGTDYTLWTKRSNFITWLITAWTVSPKDQIWKTCSLLCKQSHWLRSTSLDHNSLSHACTLPKIMISDANAFSCVCKLSYSHSSSIPTRSPPVPLHKVIIFVLVLANKKYFLHFITVHRWQYRQNDPCSKTTKSAVLFMPGQ